MGGAYDIGGRKLNLSCMGEGSPAVILEADFGEPGYAWTPIQREAARFARVCWYDRAGYGWSDPAPFPRHSDSAARDLHALLRTAGVAPPYLLVAKQLSAFHARVFRGYYPDEVAGLVLVDPTNEDMTIRIHNHIELFRPFMIRLFTTIGWFGGWRLFADDPSQASAGFSQEEGQVLAALKLRALFLATVTKELPMFVNGEIARASGDMGATPLVVLSASWPGSVLDPKLEDRDTTLRLNRALAMQSREGVWIGVPAHQNAIPAEAPEAIIGAIRRWYPASDRASDTGSKGNPPPGKVPL